MRGILKTLSVIALALYFTQSLIPSIYFANISIFALIAGLIFLAIIVIDPITRILFFIPTNFLVLNFGQILANFLVFYFASRSLPDFKISSFEFDGFFNFGINLQPVFLGPLQVTIVAAVLVYLMSSIFRWIVD